MKEALKGSVLFKIGSTLLGIQLVVYAIYLLSRFMEIETPVVIYDADFYYREALALFRSDSLLHTLQYPARPIFSFLSVLGLRVLRMPFGYQLLSFLNTAFYGSILAASLYYLLAVVKKNPPAFVVSASTLLAIPLLFDLSAELLGDVAVAAWVLAFSASLISIKSAKWPGLAALAAGVVGALGFQTKPVFLLYLGAAMVCFCTAEAVRCTAAGSREQMVKQAGPGVLLFLAGFLAVSYVVLPRTLLDFLFLLRYVNETLDYFRPPPSVFNTWLWFPTTVFEWIAFFPASLLTAGGLVRLAAVAKSAPDGLRSKIERWCSDPFAFIAVAFLVVAVYVSFFLGAKDGRTLFFLLPLFVILTTQAISGLGWHWPVLGRPLAAVALAVVAANLGNTLSWTLRQPLLTRWFNRYLLLSSATFVEKVPGAIQPLTYEALGVFDLIQFLNQDCSPGCRAGRPGVFIPHGSWYNETTFSSAFLHIERRHSWEPAPAVPYHFASAAYRFGGFRDGGIPRTFFTARYVVLVKDHLVAGIGPRNEIYNLSIARALSARRPDYLDGLREIYTRRNRLGEKLIVYRRDRLPSRANYLRVVEALVEADPNNLWNAPFIYAAAQIDRRAIFQSQLERMAQPTFQRSAGYHYGTPDQEMRTRALLAGHPPAGRQESEYPAFLFDPAAEAKPLP